MHYARKQEATAPVDISASADKPALPQRGSAVRIETERLRSPSALFRLALQCVSKHTEE